MIPESVHVHPFDYTISTDRTELLEACLAQETDLAGQADHKRLRILLDEEAAPAYVAEVLVHETLHAMMTVSGLLSEIGADEEERIVNRLAPVLLALIRDNPDLLAYLTA